MRLIHPTRLREYEEQANNSGFSFDDMMRVAGKGLAEIVDREFAWLESKKVTGLIGGGKNGTDTLIALTHLINLGWHTWGVRVTSSTLPEWAITAFEKTGGALIDYKDQAECVHAIKESEIILDGIIGTGFTPPMREDLAGKLKELQKSCEGKRMVAVDCPSGLDCDSGMVDAHTIPAKITVCMEAVKPGLLKFPAFNFVGEICQVDIGIVKKVHVGNRELDLVLDDEQIAGILPTRQNDTHKGSFGNVLICGGSVNYPGAPVFAAKAAYKSGTGLVKSAVPERIYAICASQHLDSTWLVLDDENGVISESGIKVIQNELPKVNCLAIGPGLGSEETTFRFFKEVVFPERGAEKQHGIGFVPNQIIDNHESNVKPPFVVDADGLKMLVRIPNWYESSTPKMVLTPHPGEMSILTGLSVKEIQANRIDVCREFARKWGQVIVLKGALTVIGSPDGRIAVCPIASSALAKGGSGDVLTGLIAGLISQGMGLFDAAIAGVWIHASAGVLAASSIGGDRGVGITDILSSIPAIFSRLEIK